MTCYQNTFQILWASNCFLLPLPNHKRHVALIGTVAVVVAFSPTHFLCEKNESYMFTRLSIFYIHRIVYIFINKKNKKHSELKYGKAHQTTSALHERLFGDWQTTLSIQMHIQGPNKLSVYHTNLISHESAFIERKLNKDLIIIIYTEKKIWWYVFGDKVHETQCIGPNLPWLIVFDALSSSLEDWGHIEINSFEYSNMQFSIRFQCDQQFWFFWFHYKSMRSKLKFSFCIFI